jgi:predicted nuclease of restriction endonuclease-like (RecB) superfamily
MRRFYLGWPPGQILQTPSEEFAVSQTAAGGSLPSEGLNDPLTPLATRFPLPWSHYVLLLKVEKTEARRFYEAEAHRNGWTVRQLERQITTFFYERTLASRNKGAMFKKGAVFKPGDAVSPEEEIKDPFVLEFLGLKDEYSESDLEEWDRARKESQLQAAGESHPGGAFSLFSYSAHFKKCLVRRLLPPFPSPVSRGAGKRFFIPRRQEARKLFCVTPAVLGSRGVLVPWPARRIMGVIALCRPALRVVSGLHESTGWAAEAPR